MKKNYKKGFSLPEFLIVFLLVSMMLAVFAPIMTKKPKKKIDPNCPTGIKQLYSEYTTPGTYLLTIPENIINDAEITLVGAGGKGGDADIKQVSNEGAEPTIYYATGGGGEGGEAYVKKPEPLTPGRYIVTVGAGGGKGSDYDSKNTSFAEASSGATLVVAKRGGDGKNGDVNGNLGGIGGNDNARANKSQVGGDGCYDVYTTTASCTKGGKGGGNSYYSGLTEFIGASGNVCTDDSCNIHGKPGSDYIQNGASNIGFVAGIGGGGAGVNVTSVTAGYGGQGGDGYAKIEYQVRCD